MLLLTTQAANEEVDFEKEEDPAVDIDWRQVWKEIRSLKESTDEQAERLEEGTVS